MLSNHQGVYQLWNAHTGEKFSVNDAYCPLQNIACLINSENVSIMDDSSYRLIFDPVNKNLLIVVKFQNLV